MPDDIQTTTGFSGVGLVQLETTDAPRLVSGCLVSFGDGLQINHAVPSFDLRRVQISGFPASATEKDIQNLLLLYGFNATHFIVTAVGPTVVSTLSTADVLMSAAQASQIPSLSYNGESLRVSISTYTPLHSMRPTSADFEPNTLHISWPAPCVDYVVVYIDDDDDDASAPRKAAELNGGICAGRPVRVRLNVLPPGTREPPMHWRANSIVVTDVPLWAKDKDVEEFAGSPFVRRQESRLFDADAAVRWMESDLRSVSRGTFQYEMVSERADPVDGIVNVKARYERVEDAMQAMLGLRRKSCGFIARGKREVWMSEMFKYVAEVPGDEFAKRQARWSELCATSASQTQGGYNVWIEHLESDVHVHLSGSTQEAVGPMKVRIEELVREEKGRWTWTGEANEEQRDHLVASTSTASGLTSCPVCLCVASAPLRIGCGHTYCRACLTHFLLAASASPANDGHSMFPLRCIGDGARCNAPIPMGVIQFVLDPEQLEAVLESAFTEHVAGHPKELRWCPTPGCTQLCALSSSEDDGQDKFAQCPSCFARVCMTYQAVVDPDVEERKTNTWVTQQHGRVAPCPLCGVLIQKEEGCNHVACRCGAHICWRCMRTFDRKDVYKHMHEVHGGIGTPGPMPEADMEEQHAVMHQAEERRREQRRREQGQFGQPWFHQYPHALRQQQRG